MTRNAERYHVAHIPSAPIPTRYNVMHRARWLATVLADALVSGYHLLPDAALFAVHARSSRLMPKPANMPPAGRAWPFTWFLPGTMSPYNGEPHPSAPFATHDDLF